MRRAGPVAAALVLAVAACQAPPDRQAQRERGRAIYNFRCYFCHGYSGDARTLAATFLEPRPRDFTASDAKSLVGNALRTAVRDGRPGTAMKSFKDILSPADIDAVAVFVEEAFILRQAGNTRYHTAENGWPNHERYAAAFPFATGALPIDAPADSLDAQAQAGRSLFMSTCVSCHDRAHPADDGPPWSARPLSYPRAGFVPGQALPPLDGVSGASVYAKHEVVPVISGLTRQELHGQALFQANCAFCHGADGTGKNWIGQFMEPKARDLTAFTPQALPAARLQEVIRKGLEGTSMPAWQHVLDDTQIQAVSSYVLRAFVGHPTGTEGTP